MTRKITIRVPQFTYSLAVVNLASGYMHHDHRLPPRPTPPYLVKQGDIERKAELVLEADLVAELVTELAGRGRRVSQQRLGVAVHEGDGQHQRLLVLRGL